MKKYIVFFIIGLVLFVIYKRGKKVLSSYVLAYESIDWLAGTATIQALGKMYQVAKGKDFFRSIGDGLTLHSATFGNSVIVSLKEGDKVIKALEIDYTDKKVIE